MNARPLSGRAFFSAAPQNHGAGAAVGVFMQDTIDVVVTWAGTPLAVERLARGQKFTLGAAPSHTSPDSTLINLPCVFGSW